MALVKKKRQIAGQDSEVCGDDGQNKEDQSHADILVEVIHSLNETRRTARRLNDRFLLHLIDMAALQVSEALSDHLGPDEPQRKSS